LAEAWFLNGFRSLGFEERLATIHPQSSPLSENRIVSTARIDKWLWAARFFKTRSLAARACGLGRIQCNQQPAKAAREVRVGDLLQIKTDHEDFQVEVLLLSAVRGPASVARTLYRETEASRELRLRMAEERKASKIFTPAPPGRPSKRDRRKIIQFRNRG
jgi:ribosome-associated heat shock protein Hsp15